MESQWGQLERQVVGWGWGGRRDEDLRHAGSTHLTTGQAGQQAEGTGSMWEATSTEGIHPVSARRGPVAQAASGLTVTELRERKENTF